MVVKHLNKFPQRYCGFSTLIAIQNLTDKVLGKLFSCHFQVQVFLCAVYD